MDLTPLDCKITVRPVTTWLSEQEDTEQECRTCLIAPLAGYYASLLEDQHPELFKSLEDKWESGDPLTIAKELDRIKNEVGEDLKNYLKSLDCVTQTFEKTTDEKQ